MENLEPTIWVLVALLLISGGVIVFLYKKLIFSKAKADKYYRGVSNYIKFASRCPHCRKVLYESLQKRKNRITSKT